MTAMPHEIKGMPGLLEEQGNLASFRPCSPHLSPDEYISPCIKRFLLSEAAFPKTNSSFSNYIQVTAECTPRPNKLEFTVWTDWLSEEAAPRLPVSSALGWARLRCNFPPLALPLPTPPLGSGHRWSPVEKVSLCARSNLGHLTLWFQGFEILSFKDLGQHSYLDLLLALFFFCRSYL